MPPVISYSDLFDFEGYKKNINDLKTANKDFADSTATAINRLQQEYTDLAKVLRSIGESLKNFDVTGKDAARTMADMGASIDKTVNDAQNLKTNIKGLGQTTDTVSVSVQTLTNWMKTLENQAKQTDLSTEKGKQTFSDYTKQISQVSVATQKYTQQLKDSKRGIDAAEGSYYKLQQETAALSRQLKSLPDAFNASTGAINKSNKEAVQLQQTILKNNNTLKAYDAQLGQHFRNVGNYPHVLGNLTGGFKSLLTSIAALAGLDSIFGFLKQSIDEFIEADTNASRLKNTLDNLGKGQVFDRLSEKAQKLAQTFTFLDNDQIIEVFQQLITYGKLTETEISDLTPVIIDFASKSKLSLQDATSVIIKALEGNAKALKEYGINIKDGADVTERLSIIMKDLKPRVDGAAAAFGETFEGKLKSTRQEIKNLQEDIGRDLAPAIAKVLEIVKGAIEGTQTFFHKLRLSFVQVFDPEQFKRETAAETALAEQKKLQNEVERQRADFLKKSDKDQQQAIQNQIALVQGAQDTVLQLEKKGASQALYNAKQHLKEQQAVLADFARQFGQGPDTEVLGFGDDSKGKTGKAEKKGPTVADKVHDLQNLLQKELELELQYDELRKEAGEISETDFVNKKFELTKTYIKQAIDLEKSLGKDANQAKILELETQLNKEFGIREKSLKDIAAAQKAADAKALSDREKEFTKQFAEEGKRRHDIQEKEYQDQIDQEDKLFELQKARGFLSFNDEIKHLERVKKIRIQYAKDTADIELLIEQTKEQRRRAIIDESIQAVQGILSGINELEAAQSEARIEKIEDDRKKELALAGNNAAAQQAINDRYDKKVNQEKAKQAKTDRTVALFNVAINTAQAISKTLAQFGMPLAIPFIAADVAIGALQTAAILSKPLPKFRTGTTNAPEGFAEVDEAGRELIQQPTGEIELGSNKSRITYLKRGAKVFTAQQTKEILRTAELDPYSSNKKLSIELTGAKKEEQVLMLSEALRLNDKNIEQAFDKSIKGIPVNNFYLDERGYRKTIVNGNNKTTYLNQKHSFN